MQNLAACSWTLVQEKKASRAEQQQHAAHPRCAHTDSARACDAGDDDTRDACALRQNSNLLAHVITSCQIFPRLFHDFFRKKVNENESGRDGTAESVSPEVHNPNHPVSTNQTDETGTG